MPPADRWVDIANARFIKDDRNTYGEELIDQAKKLNANFVLLSFTGTSGERERWHWRLIPSFVRRCHDEGLRVSFYMKLTNINWKPMFHERPESRHWIMVYADGSPAHYGGHADRYMGCLAKPEWRAFLKEMIAEAVKYEVDALFYDNCFIPSVLTGSREEGTGLGWACYCDTCREQFRAYTEEALGWQCALPEEPDWSDPVWQAFIEFRDKTLVDAFREIVDYAHALKPDIVVYPNVKPPFQGGGGTKGSATTQLAGVVDLLLFERRGTPKLGVPPEGGESRALNVAVDWKYALALKDTPLWYRTNEPGADASYTPGHVRIGMAEASSFGGAYHNIFARVLEDEPAKAAGVELHYDFLRRNAEYYTDVRPVADVAILESGATSNWYLPDRVAQTGRLPESVAAIAQALVELHLPFNVVVDDDLPAGLDYKVLVLSDVACMSDEQADAITRFVEKGGGLLATGATSLYDERYRTRKDFALTEVFGVHHGEPVDGVATNSYGDGACAYLPGQVVDDFWLKGLSRDLATIEEAMTHVVQDGESLIRLAAPSTTLVNVMEKADGAKTLVHLVNYETRRVAGIEVSLRRPTGRTAGQVSLLSPDSRASDLEFTEDDQSVAFTIPVLEVYDLVVVDWK